MFLLLSILHENCCFTLKKFLLKTKKLLIPNRHGSPALKTKPDGGDDKGDKAEKMIRALLGL